MGRAGENKYDDLKRIFHEPKRLAIMSALCASQCGKLTFPELKQICAVSDGNLNRHLKVLKEAGAVTVKKKFQGVKPCTIVHLSAKGLNHFKDYLEALEQVLKEALESMPAARAGSVAVALPEGRKILA